jgi:AcrR family transcriptional regulator
LGPKERRVREREEIREKILDAARELFAAEGFEAVTMRRIADAIEYTPTAIYFHFRDKEALLKELCDTDFRSLAHQFARIARVRDPIDRLRATGQAYAEFGFHYPNHYRLMFMTPHPPIPHDDNPDRDNPEEDAYAFLRLTVEEAMAQKRLRPELTDPELVAQTVWAGVHGVVSLQIAKANDSWVKWRPVKKRVQKMLDMIIAGIVRE